MYIYIYTYTYIHRDRCVCMYVYIYIYIYVYTHDLFLHRSLAVDSANHFLGNTTSKKRRDESGTSRQETQRHGVVMWAPGESERAVSGGRKCAIAGVPWRGSVSACLAWVDLLVKHSLVKEVLKRLSLLRHRGRRAGVCCEQNTPFAQASAQQTSSRNSSSAPDLALFKLIFQRVLFYGGVIFSQTPL